MSDKSQMYPKFRVGVETGVTCVLSAGIIRNKKATDGERGTVRHTVPTSGAGVLSHMGCWPMSGHGEGGGTRSTPEEKQGDATWQTKAKEDGAKQERG